jgi:hypothetical protein
MSLKKGLIPQNEFILALVFSIVIVYAIGYNKGPKLKWSWG